MTKAPESEEEAVNDSQVPHNADLVLDAVLGDMYGLRCAGLPDRDMLIAQALLVGIAGVANDIE
jgi:hypothetical protein